MKVSGECTAESLEGCRPRQRSVFLDSTLTHGTRNFYCFDRGIITCVAPAVSACPDKKGYRKAGLVWVGIRDIVRRFHAYSDRSVGKTNRPRASPLASNPPGNFAPRRHAI